LEHVDFGLNILLLRSLFREERPVLTPSSGLIHDLLLLSRDVRVDCWFGFLLLSNLSLGRALP
jgi:hypothetical protein